MKPPPMFNTVIRLLSAAFLASCANFQDQDIGVTDLAVARPPARRAELPPRAVLYFDMDRPEGNLVIKGVHPDGRDAGTLSRGKVAGWSPDGMSFAVFSSVSESNETLNLVNLQGVVKTIFTPGPGERIFSHGWQSIWAPDGGRVALILQDRKDFRVAFIAVINVADSQIISRHRLPPTAVQGPTYKFRWSPDGRKVLLVSGTTLVVDTSAGTVETIAEKPTPAEWSPGSDAVFYFDGLGNIEHFFLRKLGSGKSIKLMDKGRILASGLGQPLLLHGVLMTLSPSGSKLAIAGGSTTKRNGVIHIYDLQKTGVPTIDKPSARFENDNVIISIQWAPDESALAIIAYPGVKLLDLATAQWRTLAALSNPPRGTGIDMVAFINTLGWTE